VNAGIGGRCPRSQGRPRGLPLRVGALVHRRSWLGHLRVPLDGADRLAFDYLDGPPPLLQPTFAFRFVPGEERAGSSLPWWASANVSECMVGCFMRRRRVFVLCALLVIGLVAAGVAACGPLRAFAAANRSTTQFVGMHDPRVFYEPAAEAEARVVESAIPNAVAQVEAAMGRPFHIPVRVYVCASIESFASYGASPRAGGHTINHRVFLSPKPENTPERLPRILTHELTHLHLSQDRVLLAAHTIPVWFDEGLAVDVSGGGGAENVSEAEAWRAISNGRAFVPDLDETPFSRRGAHDSGLEEHMFYRQAALYIGFLRSLDASKFDAFIAALEWGASFDESFHVLGVAPEVAWRRFVDLSKSRAE